MGKLDSYCPVNGRFGTQRINNDPLKAAGLQVIDGDSGLAEATAFVGGGSPSWKPVDQSAYVFAYAHVRTSRRRVTSRKPLHTWALSNISAVLEALGPLQAHVDIRGHRIDWSQLRVWIENDTFRELASVKHSASPTSILNQLIVKLALLERSGVVHGGIEPSFLKVRPNGAGDYELVLAGFGIPWLVASQRESTFDGLGTSVGDPCFMAPEVAMGTPPTHASDVYSAAAAFLVAMGYSEPPPRLFGEEGPEKELEEVEPERWLSGCDLPQESQVLLASFLDPIPERRVLPRHLNYSSDLSVSEADDLQEEPSAPCQMGARQAWRNSTAIAAIVILLLLGVLAGLLSLFGNASEKRDLTQARFYDELSRRVLSVPYLTTSTRR